MSVWFRVDDGVIPDVVWYCAMLDNYTNVTGSLVSVNGVYQSNFTVWSVQDDTWGVYRAIVCDKIIQNFTIYLLQKGKDILSLLL